MKIVHLGGNRLGDRVLELLRSRHGDVDSITTLEELEQATHGGVDWLVSAGFRHIVPPELLARATRCCNVHTSLLPWGRGAYPNVWVIVDDEPAGVTIHEMVEGLDAGPVLAQREVEVSFADTAQDIHQRLEDAAVELFADTWEEIASGRVAATPQPAAGSYHRSVEFFDLVDIGLDDRVSWRRALDVLRAGTFPPHENIVVEVDGRRYHVEVRVTELP